MTVVSSLVTRVQNEINDTTSNTFTSALTGMGFSELTQYVIDGIADYSNYVYREQLDNSIITSANQRSYVVSALSPAPSIITRVEYVESSTSIQHIPEIELWDGTMYMFHHDQPVYTTQDGKYFNIWYLAPHTVPSSSADTVTVPTRDEEIIVNYAKMKAFQKMGADQRGINQDTANEFLNLAQAMQARYLAQIKKASNVYTTYKG